MSELKSDKLSPRTASGTVTLGTSGDTFSIPSGVTFANSGTATGFGGDNTPAFHVVKADGTQNIGDDTLTKVTFSSTIFDTGSGVDLANNKYVVPSGEGGKYFVYGQVNVYSSVSHSMQESNMKIQINGTQMANAQLSMVANPHGGDTLKTAAILTLAAADYIEIWCHAQVSSGDGIVSTGSYNTFLGAFKLDGIA